MSIEHSEHTKCRYCGSSLETVVGTELFPNRKDLKKKFYLVCVDRIGCDSFVPCHDDGEPFGYVANVKTRKIKADVIRQFNTIWQNPNNNLSRGGTYKRLAVLLGLDVCNFSMMSDEYLIQVVLPAIQHLYKLHE